MVVTKKLRVRMYRVGFGDFFLLTVPTQGGKKEHILVDCGVHAGDIHSIEDAVADMAKETGGRLALVIMSHRHADHISGFASCRKQFKNITVGKVWMSWFEDTRDARARGIQAGLTAMAMKLQLQLAARSDADADELRDMADNIVGDVMMGFGGRRSNDVALEVLHGEFANRAPVEYYRAGDVPALPPELARAGLSARILGPPSDAELIAKMDSSTHQYLVNDDASTTAPLAPFDGFDCVYEDYPEAAFKRIPHDKIEALVQAARPDVLAAKARWADKTVNNQSLVVHFTFGHKKLLFAGDAQWGNWAHFLFGKAVGKLGTAEITDEARAILGALDFYKVGHHGSTNATPIDAVQALNRACVAMCSTQPGDKKLLKWKGYGSLKNESEVPRGALLEALAKKIDGRIARSDQVPAGKMPMTAGLKKPREDLFETPGRLFIDCEL